MEVARFSHLLLALLGGLGGGGGWGGRGGGPRREADIGGICALADRRGYLRCQRVPSRVPSSGSAGEARPWLTPWERGPGLVL